jgi:hypothetical protein
MQYVRVEVSEGRAYTYRWEGDPPLRRGERVMLPSNMVKDRTFEGTVIREIPGPDWDGPIKGVLRRVEDALDPEDRELL